MYFFFLEYSLGIDFLILMCEGDVNRGFLKNDVFIFMLILGCIENKYVFLKSRTGYYSLKKYI